MEAGIWYKPPSKKESAINSALPEAPAISPMEVKIPEPTVVPMPMAIAVDRPSLRVKPSS